MVAPPVSRAVAGVRRPAARTAAEVPKARADVMIGAQDLVEVVRNDARHAR